MMVCGLEGGEGVLLVKCTDRGSGVVFAYAGGEMVV